MTFCVFLVDKGKDELCKIRHFSSCVCQKYSLGQIQSNWFFCANHITHSSKPVNQQVSNIAYLLENISHRNLDLSLSRNPMSFSIHSESQILVSPFSWTGNNGIYNSIILHTANHSGFTRPDPIQDILSPCISHTHGLMGGKWSVSRWYIMQAKCLCNNGHTHHLPPMYKSSTENDFTNIAGLK